MANQTINVIVNSKGVVTVVKELNAMGDAARQTTTYLNGLRSILAAALTFSGVGAIVQVVDTFTTLQNRLKQVADETNTVSESWTKLLGIANSSYSTIQSTVDLYFRVAQAYKAWGESAEEAYEFTELFQKAAVLSGSSMQTTAQAVYQFSQALNKGKLDGDEFRSVLEGLPYVATLIQKSLGVTRAELYELSRDGKISVDRLKEAFEDAADVIRGDWANITPTIGMALTVLSNNWTDFVGRVQTSTGVFTIAAYAILAIANNLDILLIALTPVGVAMAFLAGRLAVGLVVIAFRDMAAAIRVLIPLVWSLNAAMLANPFVLAAVAIAAVVAAVIYFRNELGLTNERLTVLWQVATMVFGVLGTLISNLVTGITTIVKKLYEWTSVFPLILKGAQLLWNGIVVIFKGIVEIVVESAKYIAEAFIPVWQEIMTIIRSVMDLIKDLANLFIELLQPAITDLKAAWDILYRAMQPGLSVIMQLISDIWEGWQLLGNWIKDNFLRIVKDAFDGWIMILQKVLNFINQIIQALRTALALLKQVTGAGGGGGGGGGGAHYGAQFKAGEGFATGGQFKVGGTGAGRDTTPVAFRAERGERVTVETKKQQRQNDASGETSVNVPVNVVNVLDPTMAVAAMETAAGQRTILNVLRANRDEINYVLGAS